MSKWTLLRDAIVHGERNTTSSSSIHRFNGHRVLESRKVLWRGFHIDIAFETLKSEDEWIFNVCKICNYHVKNTDSCEIFVKVYSIPNNYFDALSICLESCSSNDFKFSIIERLISEEYSSLSFRALHQSFLPIYSMVDYMEYNLAPYSTRSVIVREPSKKKKISKKELLSNLTYGVDNTGNVCIWPSESILLHFFLENQSFVRGKKLIELGGGATGLVGLGLAACQLCDEILITDGHPNCIINQQSCISACISQNFIELDTKVQACLLEWSSSISSPCQQTRQKWDVVCGADCLFFKDFHEELLSTIDLLLANDGVAIFLQPRRAGTMDMFIEKASRLFKCEIIEDYCPHMSEQRDEYINKCGYDIDVHYPILLILTRRE